MAREGHRRRAWGLVLARSLLVGAATGVLGGALVFFSFGFIGFAGASISRRSRNGWEAVVEIGLSRGLLVGMGIALGLAVAIIVWGLVAPVEPLGARPWLSAVAGLIMVGSNLASLRNAVGWDVAGLSTVLAMALLVGVIVWVFSPWVLRGLPGHRRHPE